MGRIVIFSLLITLAMKSPFLYRRSSMPTNNIIGRWILNREFQKLMEEQEDKPNGHGSFVKKRVGKENKPKGEHNDNIESTYKNTTLHKRLKVFVRSSSILLLHI
jgi:hypothetical protein